MPRVWTKHTGSKTVRRRKAIRGYARRLRAAAIAFLGSRCQQCGFSDIRALQIDHVNGGGGKERRALGTSGLHHKVLMNKDIGYYQLLCANCNWIKRAECSEHLLQKAD